MDGRLGPFCLDLATVSTLKSHRKVQLEDWLSAGTAWQKTDWSSANGTDRPPTPETFSVAFQCAAENAKLLSIGIHGLRQAGALGRAAGI